MVERNAACDDILRTNLEFQASAGGARVQSGALEGDGRGGWGGLGPARVMIPIASARTIAGPSTASNAMNLMNCGLVFGAGWTIAIDCIPHEQDSPSPWQPCSSDSESQCPVGGGSASLGASCPLDVTA